MMQKKEKLANLAWISRFWALYSKLPEVFKEGFCLLVMNLSKENKKSLEDNEKNTKKER